MTTTRTDLARAADLEPWYDTEQVAHLLGICRRTLFRMIADGRFPEPVRFGRKLVRWHPETVKGWVDVAAGYGAAAAPGSASPHPVKRVIAARRVASMLGVSVSTVYRWADKLGLEEAAAGTGFAITDEDFKRLLSMRDDAKALKATAEHLAEEARMAG